MLLRILIMYTIWQSVCSMLPACGMSICSMHLKQVLHCCVQPASTYWHRPLPAAA